jgi:hypothetical protein
MRSSALLVLAAVLATGCHSASAPTAKQDVTPNVAAPSAPPAQPSSSRKVLGTAIAAGDVTALSQVLAKPDDFVSRTVTVEAKVRRNCTRRGCWMELAQSLDPALPGCRVTFKDYGFFVPLDSAGSSAKVQGIVEVSRVAPELVDHLESEGARFAAKGPDGSAREVRLVASGVELWRDAS